MMTKKKQFARVLVMALITACSSTPKQATTEVETPQWPYTIDLSEVEFSHEPQCLSEFADSIEYIMLSDDVLLPDMFHLRWLLDMAKGAEYLSKAAQQGLSAAQFNLGRMYQLGKGVPLDNQEAKRLFQQASAQGHQLATDFLVKMEAKDSTSVNDTIFEMKMIAR